MRKLLFISLACLPWLVAEAEPPADPGKPPAPLSLIVELTDGSRFIGTTEIKTLPFIAKYGRMKLAMKEVASVTPGEDRETAEVTMKNGDNLQGVLDIRPLELQTILGSVSVGIEHILKIETVAFFPWPTSKQAFILRFRAIDQDDLTGEKYRLRLNDGPVITFDEKKNASPDPAVTEKDYERYEFAFEDVRLRPRGDNVLSFELVSQSSFSYLGFKSIDFRTPSDLLWGIDREKGDPKAAEAQVKRERQTNIIHYHIDPSRREQVAGTVAIKGAAYRSEGHGYHRLEIHF